MTTEKHHDVEMSQLAMRLEQAERLLDWLIAHTNTSDRELREALESLQIAKINLDSFITGSD